MVHQVHLWQCWAGGWYSYRRLRSEVRLVHLRQCGQWGSGGRLFSRSCRPAVHSLQLLVVASAALACQGWLLAGVAFAALSLLCLCVVLGSSFRSTVGRALRCTAILRKRCSCIWEPHATLACLWHPWLRWRCGGTSTAQPSFLCTPRWLLHWSVSWWWLC